MPGQCNHELVEFRFNKVEDLIEKLFESVRTLTDTFSDLAKTVAVLSTKIYFISAGMAFVINSGSLFLNKEAKAAPTKAELISKYHAPTDSTSELMKKNKELEAKLNSLIKLIEKKTQEGNL